MDHLSTTTLQSARLLRPASESGDRGIRTSLPESVLAQGARRLMFVSGLFAAVFSIGWLVIPLIDGGWSRLAAEFTDPAEYVPSGTVVLSSLIMFSLARWVTISAKTLARVGLVYEIVVAYGLAGAVYVGSFHFVPAEQIGFDHVGLSPAIPWMFTLTALVPNEPRDVALALIGCVSAPPAVFGICIATGLAPEIAMNVFIAAFVVPNVLCGVIAYAVARVIHGFGRDIKRAREMGSYQLETLIGRGGMGEVWRARHNMLARPAAVKIVLPARASGAAEDTRTAFARFNREAQVTATLTSPNTVELYDFGVGEGGVFYYVMELLDGVDLQSAIEDQGPMPAERALVILRQVCHSLAEAHANGLIHRDIKPANIFVSRRGLDVDVVKVLDFGLVGAAPEARQAEALTAENVVTGTPAYMAPEMATGMRYDARADIYAFGCVAFWLVTGRLVFDARTAVQMIVAHATTKPEAPSWFIEMAVPQAFDDLVLACLAKDPTARPQSVDEVARRLDEIALSQPWSEEQSHRWWDLHYPVPPRSAGIPGESIAQ